MWEALLKSLNGLWKVENGKVLVQLHGADIINYHATQKMRSVKGTLRVIRGNWRARDSVSPLVLISILPKHDVTITIVDVSFHHEHHADYYSIEGVVIRKDQNEYGPGPLKVIGSAQLDAYDISINDDGSFKTVAADMQKVIDEWMKK